MSEKKYNILSTGPLSNQTVKAFQSTNVKLTVCPFIRIIPEVSEEVRLQILQLAGEKITAIFTSQHAVEAVTKQVKQADWTIFCIEGNTGRKLKEQFGEEVIVASAPNGAQLLPKILSRSDSGSFYFFCGNQRLDLIPDGLREAGRDLTEIVVYKTLEEPVVIEEKPDGILFFSPTAVRSFFSVNRPEEETVLFSIGLTTTEAIKEFTDKKIITSEVADKTSMVESAIAYFENLVERK